MDFKKGLTVIQTPKVSDLGVGQGGDFMNIESFATTVMGVHGMIDIFHQL